MNMTKLEQYHKFFQLQFHEIEKKHEVYENTSLASLFASEGAYWGEIVAISKGDNLLFKFETQNTPSLKRPMQFCVLRQAYKTELGENISEWPLSCLNFRNKVDTHTILSDVLPIFHYDKKENIVGCTKIDIDLFNSISKALEEKRKVMFVMMQPMAPTELLVNLASYIKRNPHDKNLTLEPKTTYESWRPKELQNIKGNDLDIEVLSSLKHSDWCVLQGPPGTGKSYTVAKIVSRLASEGNSICVTTQSNKSLEDLIGQEPLNALLQSSRISKTLLSSDEKKRFPSLKPAPKELVIPKGELICSTYYTLSRVLGKDPIGMYDYIVIEEASQAYLTLIAAYKKLGKKCIIVGDPMQLPPVFEMSNPSDYVGIDVETQANGMMTLIRSTDIPSFRITTSYRLTHDNCLQTGVFYNNALTSVQPIEEKVDFSKITSYKACFPKQGGTIIFSTDGSTGANCSEGALALMKNLVREFTEHYPSYEYAIISPFVKTTNILQKEFCGDNQKLTITVDTVNRIQGLTVDYSIYYIPNRNSGFAFSDNLFNVATSRSRSTTLIITDMPIDYIPIKSDKVKLFLANTPHIDNISEASKTISSGSASVTVVDKIDLSKFERKRTEIVSYKKNIYVIDTNVFVNCPDIISKIGDDYSIAMAAKVVDELDKMKIKLDEQGKRNAEKAIRNINNTRRDIMFELSDVSLLPSDFDKKSPDNMILSVAMKYKDENPILLTSDNGLQVKAKILGFKTISLKDFTRK